MCGACTSLHVHNAHPLRFRCARFRLFVQRVAYVTLLQYRFVTKALTQRGGVQREGAKTNAQGGVYSTLFCASLVCSSVYSDDTHIAASDNSHRCIHGSLTYWHVAIPRVVSLTVQACGWCGAVRLGYPSETAFVVRPLPPDCV